MKATKKKQRWFMNQRHYVWKCGECGRVMRRVDSAAPKNCVSCGRNYALTFKGRA